MGPRAQLGIWLLAATLPALLGACGAEIEVQGERDSGMDVGEDTDAGGDLATDVPGVDDTGGEDPAEDAPLDRDDEDPETTDDLGTGEDSETVEDPVTDEDPEVAEDLGTDEDSETDEDPVADEDPETDVEACEIGFVYVPPCTASDRASECDSFLMGSPDSDTNAEDDERPQHEVEITRGMCVGETEVTQGQWRATVPGGTPNPSYFLACGDDCPVERVNWYEAVYYANALTTASGGSYTACYEVSGQSGTLGGGCSEVSSVSCSGDFRFSSVRAVPGCTGYRLLTEAEREYVARAGSETVYPWGDSADITKANFADSVVGRTTEARSYDPNAFGLYGTIGNVWEWVGDWYGADYYVSSPRRDPSGPSTGSNRVRRGGSWGSHAVLARSANRGDDDPARRNYGIGFRLTRSLP